MGWGEDYNNSLVTLDGETAVFEISKALEKAVKELIKGTPKPDAKFSDLIKKSEALIEDVGVEDGSEDKKSELSARVEEFFNKYHSDSTGKFVSGKGSGGGDGDSDGRKLGRKDKKISRKEAKEFRNAIGAVSFLTSWRQALDGAITDAKTHGDRNTVIKAETTKKAVNRAIISELSIFTKTYKRTEQIGKNTNNQKLVEESQQLLKNVDHEIKLTQKQIDKSSAKDVTVVIPKG